MTSEQLSGVRGATAVVVGTRDLRSLRTAVERHAGGPAGDLVLAVEGTFDLAAAMRAATEALARARRARVKLDLRRARIEDAGLAAFVRAVAGRPVAIVGLSRHHERLLRYLDEGAGADGRT
jgi:hypothetical protein